MAVLIFAQTAQATKVVWFTIASILLVIGVNLTVNRGREMQKEDFAKEVNLHQVSVSGQNEFSAQIYIEYREGKLNSEELIPKTTAPWGGMPKK